MWLGGYQCPKAALQWTCLYSGMTSTRRLSTGDTTSDNKQEAERRTISYSVVLLLMRVIMATAKPQCCNCDLMRNITNYFTTNSILQLYMTLYSVSLSFFKSAPHIICIIIGPNILIIYCHINECIYVVAIMKITV